jgi:hypothetical protein
MISFCDPWNGYHEDVESLINKRMACVNPNVASAKGFSVQDPRAMGSSVLKRGMLLILLTLKFFL